MSNPNDSISELHLIHTLLGIQMLQSMMSHENSDDGSSNQYQSYPIIITTSITGNASPATDDANATPVTDNANATPATDDANATPATDNPNATPAS
jgi:hypothetical protein